MNNRIIIVLSLCMLFISIHPSCGQFLKRRKQPISQKKEIDTPRKRKKSRTSSASETDVKIKKTNNYISKKSKNNKSKVRLSRKSNEVAVPNDDRFTLTDKKTKPLRELKKSKKNSDKLSESQGKVRGSKFGEKRKSNTDEKVTQRVKKRNLKKQKKERENTAEKLAGSDGPISIGREGYRKEAGTIYKDDKKGGSKYKPYSKNEKVTQRVKMKSQKRQKKEREEVEEKRAGSNGPITIKREAYRKEPGTIYREDKKGGSKYKPYTTDEKVTQKIRFRNYGARIRENRRLVDESDGPVIIDMEPYRKRPGTIYRDDKKGGARYKTRTIKGANTMKGSSPDKKDKVIAKKSRRAATYQGDLALLKRNNKEMHPGSKYLEGKRQNSLEDKEKLRKKEVKKSRGRNSGQPKVVTRKKKKPKYDSRESEIWYE